ENLHQQRPQGTGRGARRAAWPHSRARAHPGPVRGLLRADHAATHDEWVAAKTAGKPRWVYRKLGVTFEDTQQDFARTVEAYATGVFRDSFHDTAELMTKVVRKVKELESGPSPLSFAPLAQPVPLRWSLDEAGIEGGVGFPLLELHVFP